MKHIPFSFSVTLGVGVAVTLAGCAVGPDFHPAKAVNALSRGFLDGSTTTTLPVRLLTGTTNASVDARWWTVFHDPILSRLENEVGEENLDVRTATLRLAESRSQVASVSAAALPTLSANASDYRQAYSQNGLIKLIPLNELGPSTGLQQLSTGFNAYSVGFDASWEIDLWGHVARQIEAADAQMSGQAEFQRGVLISSLAEVARDYVNLRGVQEQIRIVKNNIKVEQEILDVTRTREGKGLVTGLDVSSAAAQVDFAASQVPTLEREEVQSINAICFLLGKPPLALSNDLARARNVPPNPPRVPIGLSSDLARRRPDVRRAEAELHAATANIGVAVAEFYPSVRLNGSPTLQALAPKDIFKGSSLQYVNVGPSVTLPLFEGGRLKSNLVLQEKRQQEAAIAYHKAVLSAWHDVVNALTAFQTEKIRRQRLHDQVDHAREALIFARRRYDEGVTDITTLLDNARIVLQAEQQFAQSTTNVSLDLIALYKALGGGWEYTYPDVKAAAPRSVFASALAAVALPMQANAR